MALTPSLWSPLRSLGSSTLGSVSACRWNSTAARDPAANLNNRRMIRRRAPNRQKFIEDQRAQAESRSIERFQSREWRSGDIYSPHDLSAAEMNKWRKRHSPSTDAFDNLNIKPLDLYKNFSIMSEYMTNMGRIKHRNATGLRPVNQRKVAKAIRRAIGLGLMPSVHRHPEILASELKHKADSQGLL